LHYHSRGQTTFEGQTSTARLHRKIETLIEYLLARQPGADRLRVADWNGDHRDAESALAAGDVVSIRVPEIGELSNTAVVVG